MTRYTRLILAIATTGLAGAAYWYATTPKPATGVAPKSNPPVPVTTAKASVGKVPVLLDVVGRAEAYESVTIKSRVDGQVASVTYREGQPVLQGEILVRLDPADFNAKVMQAEANLAKDQAQLAKAHADVERYVALKARGFVSDEKVNEVRTAEAAAAATAKADQAALELAKLQLSYTTLRAPFSGVIGARLVFPGSTVKINETALAVVNRIQPLYVTFSVPEKHLPKLRLALRTAPIKVFVTLPGSPNSPIEGSAKFIDNAIDTTTGSIQIKAILPNRDEKITPGQFLDVSLALDTLTHVILVPTEAIQQGAEGNFLYVVKPDETVELRKIEVLTTYSGQAALDKGVKAGETVVTDGQLRLTPGAKVKIKAVPTEKPPVQTTPAAR